MHHKEEIPVSIAARTNQSVDGEKVPNAGTEAAIKESLKHTGKKFSSVDALMADLHTDD